MAINTFKRHTKRVIGASFGESPERKLKRTDPNDPNRVKNYGSTYTERQLRILSGDLPWEVVRLTEITIVMRKAKAMGDDEGFKEAALLQEMKLGQDDYRPQITVEEAKNILRELDQKYKGGPPKTLD